MNYNIGQHALLGNIARQKALSPERRKEIAQMAAWKRWHPLSPEEEKQLQIEREDEQRARELKKVQLVSRYQVLRRFIESKGGDPDQIIEMAESQE